jgi:hypothetical protein
MSDRVIEAGSVSEGWLLGARALLSRRPSRANHLLIRMSAPLPEDTEVRRRIDALPAELGFQEVEEVRNTIFPLETAEDARTPQELVAEYRSVYEFVKQLGSPHGTYFGRIVAYPRRKHAKAYDDDARTEMGDQLTHTIDKLRKARAGQRWRATYEIDIYCEEEDRDIKRGFPCMSHLAFQVDRDRLDCLATYRSHDLAHKAYGNYLALAQLQAYVAGRSGFQPGELAVLAGHAFVALTGEARWRFAEVVG